MLVTALVINPVQNFRRQVGPDGYPAGNGRETLRGERMVNTVVNMVVNA